jgi:L-threonylcarbamoyladenylate synthase
LITKNLEIDETFLAGKLLRDGKLVAFPTETVYGLGARADSDNSIKRIFDVKGRPSFNPLIVHVPSIRMAKDIAIFDKQTLKLINKLWPGPITFVVPLKNDHNISKFVTAGLDSVAIRFPKSTIAQQILLSAGVPIAAPSANLSGRISPTSASEVFEDLGGKINAILDGGPCEVGVESTIIKTDPITLLRPGVISPEDIRHITGTEVFLSHEDASITAPGQLKSHYAPKAPVRLNVHNPEPNEVLLGFGDVGNATLNLSPSANLSEAAKNLFYMLRKLDQALSKDDFKVIAVSPIPKIGIGLAINDRLKRASAPRY